MSYLTLEVEIDHGRIIAKEPSKLPEKARGLLIIISSEQLNSAPMSQLEALDALQKNLNLDAVKTAEWMLAVRKATGRSAHERDEQQFLHEAAAAIFRDMDQPEAKHDHPKTQ